MAFRCTRLSVLVVAVVLGAPRGGGAQTLIDRALVRVTGAVETVITQLDVREAQLLKLVAAPDAPDDAIADQLVNRRLMLAELARLPAQEPAPTALEARRAQWRASLGASVDLASLQASVGMTDDALTAWLSDDLRLQAHLDRRSRAEAQPLRADLLRYYNAHHDEFTTGGVLAPFEAVEGAVRTRLAAISRANEVSRWVESLRKRVDITLIR